MESKSVSTVKLAAKRQIGTLRAQINAHGKAGNTDYEESHLRLQQSISKGRFILRHLSTCLETSGIDPANCELVATLQSLLGSAVRHRSVLYETVFGKHKKESLKAFKNSVSTLIERGEAPHWISTVSRSELINGGQELNRLFQLLIEGQGIASNIPMVDSYTLERAATRSDLFTPKQQERLQKRSIEVDEIMLEEIARLAKSLRDEEDLQAFLRSSNANTADATALETSNWACDQCTFVNPEADEKCSACHFVHDQSFLAVAKRKSSSIPFKEMPAIPNLPQKNVLVKIPPKKGASVNTVWVHNRHIPEMIGARGKNQRALIEKSGALSVYASQDKLDKFEMCPVSVHGSTEAFHKAVDILEKKFNPKIEKRQDGRETVWINNSDVPDLIGPGGTTVKRLRQECGVLSITAWQEYVNEKGMCPVDIRGSRESVKNAATRITNMFCGESGMPLSVVMAQRARYETACAITSFKGGLVEESSMGSVSIDNGTTNVVPVVNYQGPPSPSQVFTPGSEDDLVSTLLEAAANVPPVTFSMPVVNVTRDIKMQAKTEDCASVEADSNVTKDAISMSSAPTSRSVSIQPNRLLQFLLENEKCFACSVAEFGDWLKSVQIQDLEEFAEALEDDDFVKLEMKENGLKYFKRFALQKAAAGCIVSSPKVVDTSPTLTYPIEPPLELVCPIRHVLMTSDPVLASDGYTYEREAIEEWIVGKEDKVLSPMTQHPLGADAVNSLVSNLHIRTLARDWKANNDNDK